MLPLLLFQLSSAGSAPTPPPRVVPPPNVGRGAVVIPMVSFEPPAHARATWRLPEPQISFVARVIVAPKGDLALVVDAVSVLAWEARVQRTAGLAAGRLRWPLLDISRSVITTELSIGISTVVALAMPTVETVMHVKEQSIYRLITPESISALVTALLDASESDDEDEEDDA